MTLSEVVGRDAEVAVLGQSLAAGSQRLVTLTGVAGVGKTTIALEAANQVHRYAGFPVLWSPAAQEPGWPPDRVRLSAGERVSPVPPLAVPGGTGEHGLSGIPSVRLLTAHVRRIQPDFAVDASNAPVLAAVCQGLDGLPAALESAAQWTGVPPIHCARLVRRLLMLGLARPAAYGLRDSFQVLALVRRLVAPPTGHHQ